MLYAVIKRYSFCENPEKDWAKILGTLSILPPEPSFFNWGGLLFEKKILLCLFIVFVEDKFLFFYFYRTAIFFYSTFVVWLLYYHTIMSFITRQNIRGHIYLYEITSYRDKNKNNQPRQIRTRIGKVNDHGETIYTEEYIASQKLKGVIISNPPTEPEFSVNDIY